MRSHALRGVWMVGLSRQAAVSPCSEQARLKVLQRAEHGILVLLRARSNLQAKVTSSATVPASPWL
jgi:hypothetical protein